jgi:hypothetical protein
MTLLQKQYDLTTSKLKEDIFEELRSKIESHKDKRDFFGLELVNYKNFELKDDVVKIESWPITRTNPYEGVGTIIFKFQQSGNLTSISCTIEPYNKYATLLASCFFAFFLVVFTAFILITLNDHLAKAMTMIILAWTMVYGTIYLTLRYYRSVLEQYSKTVLNDLGIKVSSS